jgi:hypothetical protein
MPATTGAVKPMEYKGRNTVWGFRDRVLRNLNFLNRARENGANVHVVTELITSLLGLIVFPYEEIKRSRCELFRDYKLNQLASKGWPQWTFDVGSSDNVDDLIRHLRNAISHRRVSFSSDSRELKDVDVTFTDRPNGGTHDNWGTTINAEALLRFVLHFADLLKEWENDYS